LKTRRLLWQIYPTYLLITILALIAIGWFASHSFKAFYYDEARNDLEARALLVEHILTNSLESQEKEDLDDICKSIGKKINTRITLILPSGKVVADSIATASSMDDHSNRPEIMIAMTGGNGSSIRFSDTLKKRMMYLATPHYKNKKITMIVRAAVEVTAIDQTLHSIHVRITLGGLFIALSATVIILILSRWFTKPLEAMKEGARRFASGDLNYRLPIANSEEMASLAEAMNTMASQLNDRINSLARQRNEQQALFSSMVEGVIAIDHEGYIISMNQAAARLFNLDEVATIGQDYHEVVPNKSLKKFIKNVLKNRDVTEIDIAHQNGGEKYLSVHGSVLRCHQGAEIGAIVVLNDITRLRRLENIRRDFVANVSHELKTPVTTIIGFAETLRDGALNHKQDAERFLEIIIRQADRLSQLIKDLLTLSQLEQENVRPEIMLKNCPLLEVLNAAVEDCEYRASEKNIKIQIACDPNLIAKMNSNLFEQAVVNLIDNAITHSNPGGVVKIEAVSEDKTVTIRVIDAGCGIAEDHLPRLFERFYRVDKARSRNLGGTGLGLAIVKHITRVHGGEVKVESQIDKGSVFSIILHDAE
jgi:two-component system phosphate regulon sensor histidine kinase PhoR